MKHYRTPLFVLLALAVALVTGLSDRLFFALTDMRFQAFPREATGKIVLVGIDAPSIREVGVWPWPRSLHAKAIRALLRAGADEILFDVDFSSRSSEAEDQALVDALEEANGAVILPSFGQNVRGVSELLAAKPIPEFTARSWPATANVTADVDGRVRTYRPGAEIAGEFVPSIGAVLAGIYDKASGASYIDFSIDASSVPHISYKDVVAGKLPAGFLEGKKVLIGATAVELGDRFNVPGNSAMPGAMLQVIAGESHLQKRALARTGPITTACGLALLALALFRFWRTTSPKSRAIALAATALAVEAGASCMQVQWGVLVDTSLWQLAILVTALCLAFEEIDFRGLTARIEESRFRRISFSLADGLVCTDNEGCITFWNPGASRIFGFPAEGMIGSSLSALLAPASQNSFSLDAVFPPTDPEEGATHIIELYGQRTGGETFALEASISRWRHTEGFHYGLVLRDISERKKEEQRIRYMAEHDALTGLVNRARINEILASMVSAAERDGEAIAVIILGMDRFKDLNDTLGQDRGDQVISAVATKLSAMVPENGIAARISGDEFAIVFKEAAAKTQEMIADLMLSLAVMPLQLEDRTIKVTHSIGSAAYPENGTTAPELMANASLAMQTAKLEKRGGHVAYSPAIRDKVEASRRLEKELTLAFERQQFVLYYQPQFELATGRVIGAEALIRWRHPTRGLVMPAGFLAVLETMPLANDVGLWVLDTAFRQARAWELEGYHLRLGINLAAASFENDGLPESIARSLSQSGVNPKMIDLEVTENITLGDTHRSAEMLRRIKETGIDIALDDFGTGHASLTHLKRFPVDCLKIDQTFIRDMLKVQDDRAIVSALIGLGKLLDVRLIAEGIEDKATAEALQSMGCEEGQGYYFGRAEPASIFSEKYLVHGGSCAPRRQSPLVEAHTLSA